MKRIIITLLSLTLLLSCTACATQSAGHVSVPDAGITLNAPEGWLYGTPAMGLSSPIAVASGMGPAEFGQLFGEDGYSFYSVDPVSGLVCCIVDLPPSLPDVAQQNQDDLTADLIAGLGFPAEFVTTGFVRAGGSNFLYLRCELPGGMSYHCYVANGANTPYVIMFVPIASGLPGDTVTAVPGSIRPEK